MIIWAIITLVGLAVFYGVVRAAVLSALRAHAEWLAGADDAAAKSNLTRHEAIRAGLV